MDERDQKTAGAFPPEEEEIVRRLLESAGPRPQIPEEDLAAISSAARSAWRQQVQRRAPAPVQIRRRPLRALLLPLAAALAVAVGLAVWWALQSDSVPPTVAWVEAATGSVQLEGTGAMRLLSAGEPIPSGATLASGGDESPGRALLRLAYGATVRLDAGTRLRFASATAVELERGALYIDTGRSGSAIPAIEIRTPLGTARDIGTQFMVRVGSERSALLVRVRDGEVLTEHRGHTFRTPAGQELVLHPDGTAERHQAATYGPGWEWVLETSARFDIEGRSLQEFLAWVSRETGWQIRFADEALAASARGIVLHGSIGNLRPDRAPFAVLPGAGLEGTLEGGTLVIRRRR